MLPNSSPQAYSSTSFLTKKCNLKQVNIFLHCVAYTFRSIYAEAAVTAQAKVQENPNNLALITPLTPSLHLATLTFIIVSRSFH